MELTHVNVHMHFLPDVDALPLSALLRLRNAWSRVLPIYSNDESNSLLSKFTIFISQSSAMNLLEISSCMTSSFKSANCMCAHVWTKHSGSPNYLFYSFWVAIYYSSVASSVKVDGRKGYPHSHMHANEQLAFALCKNTHQQILTHAD